MNDLIKNLVQGLVQNLLKQAAESLVGGVTIVTKDSEIHIQDGTTGFNINVKRRANGGLLK